MHKGIEKSRYGKLSNGTEVELYTLQNANGIICKIITFGGAITEMHLPDHEGKFADVVLGYDDLDGYVKDTSYFGALIGRVANRIAEGKFELNGRSYTLAKNNGPNHLHGGPKGFHKVVWQAEASNTDKGAVLRLTYTSPDGEEGYPGALKAVVTYTLNDQNELLLDYEATSDQPTPINLTNHSYWNLAGGGTILDHLLTLEADRFTPVDGTLIPTGEIKPVKGTPMEFTTAKSIGADLQRMGGSPPGYDHNFVLNGGTKVNLAARLVEPKSRRALEVWTDQPGIQFYSGNFLDGLVKGKRGDFYQRYTGLCLETQQFPDFVHHPNFPQSILKPGEIYRQNTVFRFLVI
ncbi:aldose epimerase family protein [Pedosphaera parvula]|nr:aldose epimerase family protein [Pedosphaera parvula]